MENKTWIVVVLIILVALVAYNFKGMTGEITKDKITKITVNPSQISFDKDAAGKLVTINVNMGSIGVDRWLQLYKMAGTGSIRMSKDKLSICGDNTCTKDVTLTYKLTAGLESGTYFFRAERDNYDQIGHDLKFDSNKFIIE